MSDPDCQNCPRRASDDIIVRVDQRLSDFIERYDFNHKNTESWRERVDIRLSLLEGSFGNIRFSGKAFLGLIMLASSVIGACVAIGKAVTNHWR